MKSFSAVNDECGLGPVSAQAIEDSTEERRARFERLLAANGPALTRLAASYTRTVGDREDLLQEIALALWQALPRFRGECSERTFLFRVAQNRAFTYLARRRPTEPIREDEAGWRDRRPDPEQRCIFEQQNRCLIDALRSLPLIYREVITLALEGMSYEEISQVLGIAESNVGVRMNRGRELLRKAVRK